MPLARSLRSLKATEITGRMVVFVFAPDVPENEGTLRQAVPADSSSLMNPPGNKSLSIVIFSLRTLCSL